MGSLLKFQTHGLKPGRPTVLFVPGNLTAPAVYEGIDIFLPCQSAIIDWCKSEGPWAQDIIATRILEFIEEQDLGPTVLCGYSAGGVVTLSAAIQDKKRRLGGIVISNTGANTIGHGDPNFPQRIAEMWPKKELLEPWFARLFVKECPKALYDILYSYTESLGKEMAIECTTKVREIDLAPRLGEIVCPTLLLHGRFDTSRTESHVDVLRKGIKDIEVRYLDGGHTIMVEDRVNFQNALIDFVERTILTKG